MLSTIRRAALVTVVSMGLVACGNSSPGSDDGGTEVVLGDVRYDTTPGSDAPQAEVTQRDLPAADTPDPDCGVTSVDYFDRLIAALDGFYARCSPGDRLNFWQRPENRAWMLNGSVRPMEAAYAVRFAAGKLRVDEPAACAYLATLKEGDCNATRTLASGLVGDAEDGEPCALDEECPTGFFCRFASTTVCEGACTAQVGDGQRCDLGGCLAGFRCAPDASDEYRCVPTLVVRQPGESCNPAKDACARSSCDGSTCRELPGPGATCSPGQFCKDGWCDRTLNVCRPLIGAGEACQSWETCQDGMYCTPYPSEFCQPRLALDETCDPKRSSFDFPGVSLACASGLCDRVANRCTTAPPAPACN